MILQDRVAVVYGAGGAIGGAVARAFAAEGAKVFLTGRSLAWMSSGSPCRSRPTRRRTS